MKSKTGETKYFIVDWMKDNRRLFLKCVATEMVKYFDFVQEAHRHRTSSIYSTDIDYTNYTLLIMHY